MSEELKTRPDFDALAEKKCPHKAYPEGWAGYTNGYEDCWTTHVELLQASVDRKHAVAVDLMVKNEALQSKNKKLRDLLKDAQETLIMASLIDKSNTCDKAVAKINAGLNLDKTNP